VNGTVDRGRILSALLAAALLLTAVAWLRGAEYDEQYTLFLTGGAARPTWPAGVITAGEVRDLQAARAGLGAIAHGLRSTDVHPPLYFWALAEWRWLVGNSAVHGWSGVGAVQRRDAEPRGGDRAVRRDPCGAAVMLWALLWLRHTRAIARVRAGASAERGRDRGAALARNAV
jgi:hypothetical protein